jgi:hypothetical protein
MHCDDKRTLFILKEEIEKRLESLKGSNFDGTELKEFSQTLTEYFECKKYLNDYGRINFDIHEQILSNVLIQS